MIEKQIDNINGWYAIYTLVGFLLYTTGFKWPFLKKVYKKSRNKLLDEGLKGFKKTTSCITVGHYCASLTTNIFKGEFPESGEGHYECLGTIVDNYKEYDYNEAQKIDIYGMKILLEAFKNGMSTQTVRIQKYKDLETDKAGESILQYHNDASGFISMPIGYNKSQTKIYSIFIITSLGGLSPSDIEFTDKIKDACQRYAKKIEEWTWMKEDDFIGYSEIKQ